MTGIASYTPLQQALTGLNSFPVTAFDDAGLLDLDRYAEHVAHQAAHGASTVFPACGTGEFAALSADEYAAVVGRAVEVVDGALPVLGGVGVNLATARAHLDVLAAAGAAGALVLPPYLSPGDPSGVEAYYRGVIDAAPVPVVLYLRPEAPLPVASVLRLCESTAVIGVKDGTGDVERLSRLVDALGDRLVLLNGMPTAELSAAAYAAVGVTGYSSAVYNFVPDLATAFRDAVTSGDASRREHLLNVFYRPFGELRDRRRGYAVSLVKTGVSALLGPVGSPRPPLPEVDEETAADLLRIVDRARAALDEAAA